MCGDVDTISVSRSACKTIERYFQVAASHIDVQAPSFVKLHLVPGCTHGLQVVLDSLVDEMAGVRMVEFESPCSN